jgi:flavin-dependent dehydrogenase
MGLLRHFMTYRGYVSPLRGWHLPIAGEGQKPKVASRSVLLAGDASGAVDPWFEEGIYYALRTGEMAATACLEENAVGAYTSAYRGLWADLKWASRFAKTFYEHESFMPYFFERNRGELEKLLVDLLSGRLCYKEMYMRVSLKLPKSALAFSLKRILNTPSIGSPS